MLRPQFMFNKLKRSTTFSSLPREVANKELPSTPRKTKTNRKRASIASFKALPALPPRPISPVSNSSPATVNLSDTLLDQALIPFCDETLLTDLDYKKPLEEVVVAGNRSRRTTYYCNLTEFLHNDTAGDRQVLEKERLDNMELAHKLTLCNGSLTPLTTRLHRLHGVQVMELTTPNYAEWESTLILSDDYSLVFLEPYHKPVSV